VTPFRGLIREKEMFRYACFVAVFGLGLLACNSSDPVVIPDTGTPVSDSGSAAADSGTSAADSGRPVADSGAPAADSGAPVADSGTPAADSGSPVADSGTPAGDSGRPVADSGTPAADAGQPVPDVGGDGACPGLNPQGCTADTDCANDWICDRRPCVSSSCHCDQELNAWACNEDCGGGICADPAGFCDNEPASSGCTQFGCPDGFQCLREEGECSPSNCMCRNGTWMCRRDCAGGGTCQRD
jgi:hypothetical protein